MLSRFSRAFLFIVVALFVLASLALLHPPARAYVNPWTGEIFGEGGVEKGWAGSPSAPALAPAPARGGVIMSKLGNATAKAELGRATWKLLHTMTLRYPETPTEDERSALDNYFHLFSRLYPCGECAAEFQLLLQKFPPQTSSRRAAATWLCVVHNEVNKRLGKAQFDCADLDATYDCGCGDDGISTTAAAATRANTGPMDLEFDPSKDDVTGAGMIKGGR